MRKILMDSKVLNIFSLRLFQLYQPHIKYVSEINCFVLEVFLVGIGNTLENSIG